MSQVERFLVAILLVLVCLLLLSLRVKADDAAAERKAFFRDADNATLICNGKITTGVKCCGLADGAAVRAQYGQNIIATVTHSLRHPTAKPGDQIIIPKCSIAIWPVVPASMKTDVVFLNSEKSVYCFFPQPGG